MSDFIIRDGTGKGTRARVNEENQLEVQSSTVTANAYASAYYGRAVVLPAVDNLLNSTVERAVLWWKNTDPNLRFHLNRYYMGWNGGDTNHNRVVTARLYVGTAVPTANHVAFIPPSINLASSFQAMMTAYVWDGVGNGMTVATPGTKVQAGCFAQGMFQLDLDGSMIMGFGSVLCATVQPEEAGKCSLIVSGWYSDT